MTRCRRTWVTCAIALFVTIALAGCDWSQVAFGPAGTSSDPSEPALTSASVAHLGQKWAVACDCFEQQPLVSGGAVYAVDGYSLTPGPIPLTLRSFDAKTGASRWSTPLGVEQFGGTLAAVANGLVYVTVRPSSGSDRLVALDAKTGAVRWQVTPTPPGTGPVRLDVPVVDGPLAFITATASDATKLVALDTTGHEVWSVIPGGQTFAGRVVTVGAGPTVYVATQIHLSTGAVVSLLRGYAEADGSAGTTAVIPEPLPVQSLAATNGLVYGTWFTDFGRAGGSGAFAVHPDTGAIVWTGDLFLLAVTPGVALSDEPITGTLSARNPTTGAVLWQSDQTDPTAAATDQLAFFSYGAIRRLSDGALVGNVATAAGEDLRAVTPANGVVYAASSTKLYAFAPSAG